MRYLLLLFGLFLCRPVNGADLRFDFGELATDGSLTNFHATLLGGGGPVSWKIIPGQAPSAFGSLSNPGKNLAGGGSVLAQTSEDFTDERFPMYIYDAQTFRNFRFSTQFKIVSGIAEQMAGVVFRFQNTSNFYVVRVSAMGKNIRFYKVVNAIRSKPVEATCTVAPGTWHKLTVQCDGTQIGIWLDDHLAMPTLGDNTFSEGKIGFWTMSDAVTYFANAEINYTPVIPAAQAMINSIMHDEPRILGLRVYTLSGSNTTSILASKDPAECGKPGTDAELAAIQDGTISFGREHGAVLLTLPLHDRNGDFIAAVRFKLKSFFGETQNNALVRATMLIKKMEAFGISANDLKK